jgi:ADP-ribose pyrophosphatase YjhB (NUDIX family)
MSGRGLQLPARIGFGRWVQVGEQLAAIHSSSAWCLGDWLVYGETAYRGRYREAIEQTSLDYQTLRNYAWVAKRFSLPRRRDGLSFAHHAEVAVLQEAEQDYWLRKAEELGWSVKRLRAEVRASLSARLSDDEKQLAAGLDNRPVPAPRSQVRLNILLSAALLENCHAAASKASLAVEEWAAFILDQEARRQLRS